MSNQGTVIAYHERTKHHYRRFARSMGYLDWATQPDPFRRYAGAPTVPLVLAGEMASPAYDELFASTTRASRPVNFDSVSALFELSLGLSAWKQLGPSRWALRMNPSSGNLHPTEGYLVIGPVDGLCSAPGVFHYAPMEHALERRTAFSLETRSRLTSGFPAGTFLVGLTSIHWREAWKYGERAYRYCQHDAGHALAAVAIAAGVLGWSVRPLDGMSDGQVASLLGLDRDSDFSGAEREQPDLMLAVIPECPVDACLPDAVCDEAIAAVAAGEWAGSANALSSDHVEWDIIDQVAEACTKGTGQPARPSGDAECFDGGPPPLEPRRVSATQIIRQRRSAVAMDGRTGMSTGAFYLMLDRVMPRGDAIPFAALGLPACVHLGLFVHLVDGIPPGLYALVRSREAEARLKAAMRPAFSWEKPTGCPDGLPLYLLATGDARAIAWQVSCDQQIAGASAFSCGMIAEFAPRLERHGPWFYRRLFWETGVIGQVLYLEAEAAGLRATGIGCFFDDPVHEVFGLTGDEFQSLYHFTTGGAVEDTRLTTLPPYPEEVANRIAASQEHASRTSVSHTARRSSDPRVTGLMGGNVA